MLSCFHLIHSKQKTLREYQIAINGTETASVNGKPINNPHNTTLTETANLDYPLGNVRTALQVQETRLIAAIQSTKYLKRTTRSVCHLKEVLFGIRQYTNTQSADWLSDTITMP